MSKINLRHGLMDNGARVTRIPDFYMNNDALEEAIVHIEMLAQLGEELDPAQRLALNVLLELNDIRTEKDVKEAEE